MRALRLFRLARSARVIRIFPQLSLMLQGMLATLKVVASGMILIIGCLTIMGILAVQLLHPVNQRVTSQGLHDGCERCSRAFESTGSAVLTFTQQIITGDSWGAVSIPIIEEEPATVLYFMFVFIVIQLMILNIILSMVVESSIKAGQEDAQRILEEKREAFKEHAAQVKNICVEMDIDKSGKVGKSEFLGGFKQNEHFQQMMRMMEITSEDLELIFSILDRDGSGDISADEFIQELYKLKRGDSHKLLVFLNHHILDVKTALERIQERELAQLHMALRSGDDFPQDPSVKKPEEWPRQGTLYEVVSEVKHSLQSDVSFLLHELKRKADSHTELLQQFQSSQTWRCRDPHADCARASPRQVPEPVEDTPQGSREAPPPPNASDCRFGSLCRSPPRELAMRLSGRPGRPPREVPRLAQSSI